MEIKRYLILILKLRHIIYIKLYNISTTPPFQCSMPISSLSLSILNAGKVSSEKKTLWVWILIFSIIPQITYFKKMQCLYYVFFYRKTFIHSMERPLRHMNFYKTLMRSLVKKHVDQWPSPSFDFWSSILSLSTIILLYNKRSIWSKV